MKATRILLLCGVGLLLAVFILGIYVIPRAQSGSPATARQSDAAHVPVSDVYVDVTYATPAFVKRVKLESYLEPYQHRGQPFLIGINTHVGTIANLDLRGKVLLEDNHGERYPALGSPVVLSEHHNMYLLVFPLRDNHGRPIFDPERGHFRLLVNGVGQTPLRTFDWKLPVVEPAAARTLANTLVLALGVIGALMVILSPCAIELTTYYTGIIAGVVSSSAIAEGSARLPRPVRFRIIKNLAGFVAGFTLLYMASGATVALMGQHLLKLQSSIAAGVTPEAVCGAAPLPGGSSGSGTAASAAPSGHAGHGLFGDWARYANWVGAAFLVYFALRSLGIFKAGGTCFVWVGKLGRKIRATLATIVGWVSKEKADIIRRPCYSIRQAPNITPLNSFCAGLGLSVGCLTCMGGAILYPLLIFVGTSSWYWGALILGSYSLALALPMSAIAISVGDFAWKYAQHKWLNRGLQWTSAVVMIAVAALVVFDRTRVINSVVFTVLSSLGASPDPVMAAF